MDPDAFRQLPVEEVARLVRAAGPQVCVFPINGTRRWFLLEHLLDHPDQPKDHADQISEMDDPANLWERYLEISGQGHIDLYKMIFAHGVDTLLSPEFGSELFSRGNDYIRLAATGLAHLAGHPDFIKFYDEWQVRVRFYGNYRRMFSGTPYAYLIDAFDSLTQRTINHTKHHLFYGVFNEEANQRIAELSIAYFQQHGRAPSSQELIELYYGEPVAPVSLFIGFEKFWAYDMPLISTGSEDLYFTVAPSLYMTPSQFRLILYDHLFARYTPEPDYENLSQQAWKRMKIYYQTNAENVQGIGFIKDGIWYPRPQVILPPGF